MFRVAQPKVAATKSSSMFRRILPIAGFAATSFYMMTDIKSRYVAGAFRSFATADEKYWLIEIENAEALKDGEMMALKVGEKDSDKILVARYKGKLFALGNFWTHFGVPLAQSVLFDDKVICPAHNAAFSIIDGYPEYAPAKDGLPTFEVVEKDGKSFVKLPKNFNEKRTIYMAKRDEANKTRFVIIGGGAAGLSAAETLRQSDFTGEIIILSAEDKLGYDRTLLSKVLATGDVDKLLLRGKEFLDTYGIDFRLNSLVKRVDPSTNEVVLSDDSKVTFDKLLIATGGTARKPIIPGIDLTGVHTLRNAKDQEAIKAEVGKGKKVVIVGASFVGFECAASLVSTFKTEIDVNVVDFFSTPFERALGKDVGKVMQKMGEENGVKFTLSKGVKKLIGVDGKVSGVELTDGTVLDADVVIVGAGIQPATQLIGDGIELSNDGSIKVDPFLRTSSKNIFAAGDVANYPYWVTGDRARVEHWNHATQQGEVAAYNMLDKGIPYDSIPFFWTRNYMKTLQYAGYCREFDEVHIDGSLDEGKFVAYYIKDNKIVAFAGLNCGPSIHILKEAMKLGT